jgi:hypothetical protein
MSATLNTNFGKIKIEVFCESVPKTAEVCLQHELYLVALVLTPSSELPGSVRIRLLQW